MTRFQLLGLVIGWLLTIIIAALAVKILIKVWRDEIDLEFLISDENHEASLSRFQFLIFTFVVAMSLFYLIVIKDPPDYPAIPNQILALLGISGGSYVLAKGIQSGSEPDTQVTERKRVEVTEKKTTDGAAKKTTETEIVDTEDDKKFKL